MTGKHLASMVICAIGVTVHLLFNFVPAARAFNEPDLLTQRIRPTATRNETIDQVLGTLTSDYGIPIGIELGDPKLAAGRKIDLDLPETTVKDFLNSLIAKDPRYMWKLDGGVIHFQPVTGRDAFLRSLLDTKISHFAFVEGASRYRIFSDILNVPEIQTKLVVADVAPMIFLNFSSMQRVENGIRFEGSNLTLREMLDKLILRTNIKQWVLTRWGDNNEYITLRS